MALDFPNNPTVGQTTAQGEHTYIWTSESRWEIVQGIPVNGMPVGSVYWCPYETPLDGSIKLTDARLLLSRTTYSALWNVIQAKAGMALAATEAGAEDGQFGPGDGVNTFSLPNAAGYFLRVYGGVDPDVRVLGDVQADAIRNIVGTIGPASDPFFLDNILGTIATGALELTSGTRSRFVNTSAGAAASDAVGFGLDVSNVVPTSTENRPKNVAWNLCIVAFNTIALPEDLNAANVVNQVNENTAGLATLTGTITAYGGFSAPSAWLDCDGSAVSRTTYPELLNALTDTNVGDTATGSAVVTNIGSTAGWGAGMAISGSGIPAATTILTIDSTTQITLSQNVSATAADVALMIYPHGAGDGSTTFDLPDYRGETLRGLDDGRGVDPGRVLGSFQGGTRLGFGTGNQLRTLVVQEPGLTDTLDNFGDELSTYAFAGATQGPDTLQTGTTRSRNVAVKYIIKT